MELAQIIAKLPHVCSAIRGKLMESKTMRARERHLADEHLVNVARSGAGIGSAWAGARRGGSPYPHAPAKTTRQAKDGAGNKEILRMREVVFRLEAERPGNLEARAETLPICITAPTLEDLQHEAREALIAHMGPAHCTFRVRVRRGPPAAVSSIRPVGRPAALCR